MQENGHDNSIKALNKSDVISLSEKDVNGSSERSNDVGNVPLTAETQPNPSQDCSSCNCPCNSKTIVDSGHTKKLVEAVGGEQDRETSDLQELQTSTISTLVESTSKVEMEKTDKTVETVSDIPNKNVNRYNSDVIIDSRSLKENDLETIDNDCKYKISSFMKFS